MVGQTATVDLDVSNVLTLDMVAMAVEDTADNSVNVGWGDVRLTLK